MSILIFLILSFVLLCISLYGVFEKAGEAGWKGLVPGYNFIVWCKLIGRPSWWALLLLIPIVNIFILVGMNVDMVRSFGKYGFWDAAIAVIYAPIAFFLLWFKPENKYDAPTLEKEKAYAMQMMEAKSKNDVRGYKKLEANNPYHKSTLREWTEAVVFAVFAAAFIRMFLIEAYVIPTSSMEGSLLVGDFLFVSKAHYGIRTPMTVAQFPLIHNTVPGLETESYLKSPKLPYYRLPALETIDRNEPIVFNYPEGDSIYFDARRTYSIHDARRNPSVKNFVRNKTLRVRPIDKKDHYIKRCIAVPGDKIEIKDKQVYINDQPAENPEKLQFKHFIEHPNGINKNKLKELGLNYDELAANKNPSVSQYALNAEQVEQIKKMGDGIKVKPVEQKPDPLYLFPHDPIHYPNWTVDNFGPLTIPAQGASVNLTKENIAIYRRVIGTYENNSFEEKNGKFYINGQAATSYTFKQNYYWAMGDNRHNSEDSRVWGFVPEDHIVGKPLFIWFSTKNGRIGNGINWSRIFTSAYKMD